MTSVTKVHLSVDTIFKFFLFFQIHMFPSGDGDKSDKSVERQKRQGLQTGDRRKHAVTKGGGVGNGQAFVTTGFYELFSCIGLVARLSAFCHFCHCHRRGKARREGGVNLKRRLPEDRSPIVFFTTAKWIGGRGWGKVGMCDG